MQTPYWLGQAILYTETEMMGGWGLRTQDPAPKSLSSVGHLLSRDFQKDIHEEKQGQVERVAYLWVSTVTLGN